MPKKEDYRTLFKEIVRIVNSRAVYSDVLLIDSSSLTVAKDFATMDISNTGEKGVKIRAFDGEKWIESFATDISAENLKKTAKKLAESITKKPKLAFDDEKAEKEFSDKPKINPSKILIEKKIYVVEKAIAYFKKQKHLKNARAIYSEDYETKIFCSKNKYLVQNLSKVQLTFFAMVQDSQGNIRYSYETELQPGFEAAKKWLKVAKTAAEDSKKKVMSRKIKPGKYHCILGPEITGLLAHESFGHGMESDTVYKDRALAREWIGKRIAADFVNIVDDPSLKDKHGSYFFDDEGEISKPTYLIKKGVVSDYITEMLTAKKMKLPRSANGRCESFDHKAYARMSNTFFSKGPHNEKEMFKNIKEGIFLKNRGGGMEDPKGWGVQIQGIFAQRIKNGRLVEEYYDDVGITGYLPEILRNIKQVSKEFSINDTGHCGKGHKEWVPVSTGGSYLRIENLDLA